MATLEHLRQRKQQGEPPFACLTAYDATFARVIVESGVEALLVGDTLGMVVQGHASTLPVRVSDIVYHLRAVARSKGDALLIADMPFMSAPDTATGLRSAARAMRAGAECVKFEGGGAQMCELVRACRVQGIPVCGHLGLNPQSVNVLGGYYVQGRDRTAAEGITAQALELRQAGAQMLILECVPADLAGGIASELDIPVVGIGAGSRVDGQILVLHDLIGITEKPPRFARDFLAGADGIGDAVRRYVQAVREREFPAAEHSFS
ncbi:MAG: 3-methyl-2-oxobutanoate hydroxymethyltransferase [Gammaproteobacteria bacterium AqS3]|nr:3-methyl-2-oxobutanoate hydroxymethyltransferase [Gammaproteobacteria bacterium AqS3]